MDANAHHSQLEYICEIKVHVHLFSILTQKHSCALNCTQGVFNTP